MYRILVWGLFGLTLVGFGACVSPAPEPLNEHALPAETRARGEHVAERLSETLREAGLDASQPLSRSLAPAYRDAALAHAPEVRRRRREVARLREIARSAGQPGPLFNRSRAGEHDREDYEIEVAATFDLFGVLGVGPAEAARLLAEERIRRAAAQLEAQAWSSAHDADRAWVEYVTACCHAEIADTIAAMGGQDAARIRAFVEGGAIGPGPAGRALAFAAAAEQRAETMRAGIAARRSDLAQTIGLSVTDPLLAALDTTGMSEAASRLPEREAAPEAEALLRRHPALRALRLEYAVAEAELRAAVAAQWPTLNIGPRVVLRPDTFIPGGLMQLSLPFPGSQDGFIAAALERRQRAREALEDGWLAAEARLHAALERVARARRILNDQAERIDAQSAIAFRAARAKLQIDPSFARSWADALQDRGEGALARANARRELLLAIVDLREAGGLAERADSPTAQARQEVLR
jgi:outer membrane protein TolC